MMDLALYTILVVDDEIMLTNLLSQLLRNEGYQVVATTNPLEAIAILSKQHVDILLSDIEMPGLNGLELVKFTSREYPSVLRILLTGYLTTDSLLCATKEGQVFRYVQKPFHNRKLLATLKEATEHLRTLRQSNELSQMQQWQEPSKAKR
jgi:DNA-binding NtrC family response regulator